MCDIFCRKLKHVYVNMATVKLSMQDKKDLDKFAKYLVYKCIQIIVQSRLGEKVKTQSKAYATGSDWVSLLHFGNILIE